MDLRGIRGAVVAVEDSPEEIILATRKLLESILASNPDLTAEDIASVIFTTTPDLTSAYPAKAAREMGWNNVPLLCCQEMPVADSLPSCIRILVHWNTDRTQNEINHVYLGQAGELRPDLVYKGK